MADIAVRTVSYPTLTTATKPMVHLAVKGEQHTVNAGEDIVEGAPVRLDPATGRWMNAAAGTAANAAVRGIALRSVKANNGVTVVNRGVIEGLILDALPYGAPVYLSNTAGRVSDVAGTVPTVIGYVLPVFGHDRATGSPAKLLKVTL